VKYFQELNSGLDGNGNRLRAVAIIDDLGDLVEVRDDPYGTEMFELRKQGVIQMPGFRIPRGEYRELMKDAKKNNLRKWN
jgi:hypothetical protein